VAILSSLLHSTRYHLPSRPTVNRLGWILGLLGAVAAIVVTVNPGRLVLQARTDHSVPFRLGLRIASPTAWRPGDLVQFRTRDLQPYYPPASLFTKAVAAGPGDRLFMLGRDFYVNGVFVGSARETDAQGRAAPLFAPPPAPPLQCPLVPSWVPVCDAPATIHDCIVPAGALFVLGSHLRSFDSRYWGFVHHSEILGRVLALL
jgi:type IV secretory pathway protease TraF